MISPGRTVIAPITRAVLLICCVLCSAFGQTIGGGERYLRPLAATGHYTFTGRKPPPMKNFNCINLIVNGIGYHFEGRISHEASPMEGSEIRRAALRREAPEIPWRAKAGRD